jgi:hypothetical protein
MPGHAAKVIYGDYRTRSPAGTASTQDTAHTCDDAARWQQWRYEEAPGTSVPVHLPCNLLRRLWQCTIADDTTLSRER